MENNMEEKIKTTELQVEKNLELLDNVMKPYFDKKKEMEELSNDYKNLDAEKEEITKKISELKSQRLAKSEQLKKELAGLNDLKEKAISDFKEKMNDEIEAYINKAKETNSNFYANYGSLLRRDLEKGYNVENKIKEIEESFKEREAALIAEIENLKNESEEEMKAQQQLEDLRKQPDYSRVYKKELIELKSDLRIKLFAKLREEKAKFNAKMNEIENFKYEYNEQQQIINGSKFRKIFDESNEISYRINEIEKALLLTELTKEEIALAMMSMTPWEKAEYDRRKTASTVAASVNEFTKEEPVVKNDDIVEIDDPVVSKFEEKDGNIVVDDMNNLLKTIYNEIVKEAMKLNSVKLNESKTKDGLYISSKSGDEEYKENGMVDESIKLPCGEYLNNADINQAIDNLYSKTKDRKYIVKSTGKTFKISEETIKKLKRKFKKCSTIKLVKEKKVSKLDILKVFGKKKANKVMNEVEMSALKDVNVPEGDYINRNDLISNLDNLFTTKKLEWLKSLSSSLKDKKDSVVNYFKNKRFDEEMNLEETRVIKK